MPKEKSETTIATGVLVPRVQSAQAVVPPTTKNKTIQRLLSALSIWPFRNRAFVKSLDTAQEVIEKQNKLEETIIRHAETRGKLNDLKVILERNRYERRQQFLEAQRRYSNELNESMLDGELLGQKNKIKRGAVTLEEMEQEKQKLKLRIG